jgi:hypothetical protein
VTTCKEKIQLYNEICSFFYNKIPQTGKFINNSLFVTLPKAKTTTRAGSASNDGVLLLCPLQGLNAVSFRGGRDGVERGKRCVKSPL